MNGLKLKNKNKTKIMHLRNKLTKNIIKTHTCITQIKPLLLLLLLLTHKNNYGVSIFYNTINIHTNLQMSSTTGLKFFRKYSNIFFETKKLLI